MPVTLNEADRHEVQRWLAAHPTPQRVPQSCWIVLSAAKGQQDKIIATGWRINGTTPALRLRRCRGQREASETVMRTFQGDIGIDNNAKTQRKLGTAIFAVMVRGKQVFRSNVMRGSDPALPVEVELKVARDFVLRVLDAGDGPEYDEADWADASVTLENGRRMNCGASRSIDYPSSSHSCGRDSEARQAD